jgi:hypothetical protein
MSISSSVARVTSLSFFEVASSAFGGKLRW